MIRSKQKAFMWSVAVLIWVIFWAAEAADHSPLVTDRWQVDTEEYIRRGDNFMATHDYGLAITLYKAAKQGDPKSQAARARLALAYARKGENNDIAMAQGWAMEVLDEDGCHPVALYAMALALEKEGNTNQARELLNWVGDEPKYKGLFFDAAELRKRLDERSRLAKEGGGRDRYVGCPQRRSDALPAKTGKAPSAKEDKDQHALPEWAAEFWRQQGSGGIGGHRPLETGLQVEDTRIGIGPTAKAGDQVLIHYTAQVLDGPTFEKTHPPNAVSVKLGGDQTIQGLSLGIPGMKVGGTRRIRIPPALGFGNQPHGEAPPNSTLVYLVSLVAVLGSGASMPARAGQGGGGQAGGAPAEGNPLADDVSRLARDYSAARMVSFFTGDPIVCLVGDPGDLWHIDFGGKTWLPLREKAVLVWVDPEGAVPYIEDELDQEARNVMKALGVGGPLPQIIVAQAAKNSSEPDKVICRVLSGMSPADWVSKVDACVARTK